MIALNSFEPYNLRDLETSIAGVAYEIHQINILLTNIHRFKNGTNNPKVTFRKSTLETKTVKAECDLSRLKVIKAELLYLYELSKMKLQYFG